MNKISVKVMGTANTGKSTIMMIIDEALKAKGFQTKCAFTDGDRTIKNHSKEKEDAVAKIVEVDIEEIQLKRHSKV